MTDEKTKKHSRLRDAFFRRKWILIILIAAVLIFFGRIVDNKALTQSALIIGLGIDKTGNSYSVSAQSVLVASGTGDSQAAQSFAVYSADGSTISEALDKISQKMGLLVSLSHCNVVILSQNALQNDFAQLFAPLTTAYALPEQAIVTSCAQTPEEVLSAKIGSTVAAPYFIQASLLQNLGGDGLALISVKDFMAHTLSVSASVNIPVIELKEMDNQPQQPAGETKENMELTMNKNLIVSQQGCFELEEKHAQALTLLLQKNVKGKLSPVLPTGEALEFRVLSTSSSRKAEGMKVKAEIEIDVSFMEAQNVQTGDRITPSSEIVKQAAEFLAREIESKLYECHALSLEKNVDFLRLQNEVYKKLGRDMPENCLADIAFECSVKVTVKENG